MRKIVLGVVALAILAGAAFFGFTQWTKARARAEVEQVFTALRLHGAKATHGDIGFDLSSRTVTIDAIALDSTDGRDRVKAARLVAHGISQPKDGRFSAKSIELNALEVTVTGRPGEDSATYTLPTLRIENYEGPTALLSVPAGEGRHEMLRFGLRHFGTLAASKILVPELKAQMKAPAPDGAVRTVNSLYSGLSAEGIGAGRIARFAFDRMTFDTAAPATPAPASPTPGAQPPAPLPAKGQLDGLVASDIDTAPILALTQNEGRTGGYRTVYGRITAKGYGFVETDGSQVNVGAVLIEGSAVDPALISLDRLDEIAALTRKGETASSEETAKAIDLTADVMRGVALAKFEIKDIAITDPSGKLNIGTMGFSDLRDGKLGAFSIQKLTGQSDQKPVKMDKLELRGFTLTPLFKISAEAARNGMEPSVDAAMSLMQGLESFSVAGLQVPRDDSSVPISIGAFDVSWGNFIGAVPTRVSLKASGISGPITEDDGAPFSYLVLAGMKTASIDLELNLAYDAPSKAFTVAPAAAQIEKAFKVSLDAGLNRVPRSVFEDPAGLLGAAQEITAGPAKLVLTNLGIADLLLKERAKEAGVEPEDLRAELISLIEQGSREFAADYPDALGIGTALAAFVKAPGTFTLTLTPKGDVPLMDLISPNPLDALQAFTVTATSTAAP